MRDTEEGLEEGDVREKNILKTLKLKPQSYVCIPDDQRVVQHWEDRSLSCTTINGMTGDNDIGTHREPALTCRGDVGPRTHCDEV